MRLALVCDGFGVDKLEDLGHGAMPVLEKLFHTQGQLGIAAAEVCKPELEVPGRRRDVDRLKREPCLGRQTEDVSISSTYVRNRRRGSGGVGNQGGFPMCNVPYIGTLPFGYYQEVNGNMVSIARSRFKAAGKPKNVAKLTLPSH